MKPLTRRWLIAATATSLAAVVLRVGPRRERPRLLRNLVERDYDATRLVNVRGWLVSPTEARFWSLG